MTIRKVKRRAETRLVVDITWKKKDGTQGRYRHDAEVQTMAAVRAEERRILANIAQHGEGSGVKPIWPGVFGSGIWIGMQRRMLIHAVIVPT